MQKYDFQILLGDTFERLRQLTATKGEEYTQSPDQLMNFKRYAAQAQISTEQAWLVLYTKHHDSIMAYIRNYNGVTVALSEPIESRIDDAILYLILLKAMERERSYSNSTLSGRMAPDPNEIWRPKPGDVNYT